MLAASGDDADALVHFVNGLVDVPKSALLEALGEVVVLFVGDILVRFFEQFLGAVQAAGVVEAGVNRRMESNSECANRCGRRGAVRNGATVRRDSAQNRLRGRTPTESRSN